MLFSKKTAAVAAVTLLGGSANAQLGGLSGLGLSSSCTGSALSLIVGPLNTCLSLTTLAGLFTTSGSIVAPLDSYLNNDICNTDACSTDTLSSANQTINDNCQEDIQNGNTLITALRTVLNEYPTIREAVCLQASGNNTRCITQSLYGIQNATGQQIDTSFVTGLLGSGNTSLTDLAQLDSNVVCTGCNQAIYQIASESNNSTFASGAVGRAIGTKCGSDFTSSTTFPTDVKNPIDPTSTNSAASGASSSVAATSSAGGNNAAGRTWSLDGLTVIAAGAMGLGVVGGAFGVLA